MIATESITIEGVELVRTYSTEGFVITRNGYLFAEAIDPPDSGREYEETDVVVEVPERGLAPTEADDTDAA